MGANWTTVAWNQSMVDELNNVYKTSKVVETVLSKGLAKVCTTEKCRIIMIITELVSRPHQ